jgi:hypothetical protein
MNLLRRLFKRNSTVSHEPQRPYLAPFPPEYNVPSPLKFKTVYDHLIIGDDKNFEGKRRDLKENYDIILNESPLRITVKGKKLKGLKGSTGTLSIIDARILIVCDLTPYRNVHAFDLEGNHLWDIEGCSDETGEPNYSFGNVSGIVKDQKDRDLLLMHYFPVSWVTDLETGKGTRIWSISDDTDMK